jgi:dihydrofolate reductase
MGKVVVSQFMSLDGVIEDPGGAEDYRHGGWAFKFDRGDDGDKFKLDEVMGADALLLGRTTFEGFAAAWPSREGEFADKFNTMPKYVVSDTLADPEWSNSTVIRGDDVTAEVARLRDAHDGDVLVNGSAQLVQALARDDLVDEYRLMVFPVALGEGKRMFAGDGEPLRLRLAGTQPVGPDGVIVLTYEPARAASDGD